ncbi:Transducin beta-like protein 3, partial [Intoshia linei]
ILYFAIDKFVLFKYNLTTRMIEHKWKAIHISEITILTSSKNETCDMLATGSTDCTIKLWNVSNFDCIANFKHTYPISNQCFLSNEKFLVSSCINDGTIYVWSLENFCLHKKLSTHYDVATCLEYDSVNSYVYSAGRDNILAIFDVNKDFENISIIPTLSIVESIYFMKNSKNDFDQNDNIAITNQLGFIKILNSKTKKCTSEINFDKNASKELPVFGKIAGAQDKLIIFDKFKNIIYYFNTSNLNDFTRIFGTNDEIYDVKFINENILAIASNTGYINVLNLSNFQTICLEQHGDSVLSLDYHESGLLISSAKDKSIKIWDVSDTKNITLLSTCSGHLHSITGVVFFNSGKCFISVSEDLSIKLWEINKTSLFHVELKCTERAHDKIINNVAISKNDKFAISVSFDKTAKIWKLPELNLVATLTGHIKGVWCGKFSSFQKTIATSSADGTVKIWNLDTFKCMLTLDGHLSAVYSVCFISNGNQILSGDASGIVKLWNICSGECINTFDCCTSKIWCLEAKYFDDTGLHFVVGSADGDLIHYKDVTKSDIENKMFENVEKINMSNDLDILVNNEKYIEALKLAFNLDSQYKMYLIMKKVFEKFIGDSTIINHILEWMNDLDKNEFSNLLKYISVWNTKSIYCDVAQELLEIIIRNKRPDYLFSVPHFGKYMEEIISYSSNF